MLLFPDNVQVFLRTGATDMRKSINGLSALVQNEMKLDPFRSGYFIFCNKGRRLIKILYWDRNGFAMWYKRLEEEKFAWPKGASDTIALTRQQIEWLLAGLDWRRAHKTLSYSYSS
jgi:transposase